MEEYYENLDKHKNKNYKLIILGMIMAIIGYLILILNLLDILIIENLLITIISLIIIHSSPIFISKLYYGIKNKDYGEIGHKIKPFIIIELIFIIISLDILFFL